MDVAVLILVILHVAVTSETESMPETMDRVFASQKLILPCSIKMTIRSGMLQWRFRPRGAKSYKLICMKKPDEMDCVKSDYREAWLESISINMDGIEIGKVTSSHSGTFQCNYMDSSNLEKFVVDVNVLTPPGKPKIRMDSTNITENNVVNLTCESYGGNPKPSLKWTWKDFSNKSIQKQNVRNQTIIQTETLYGSTVQISLWTPKSSDDSNSIRCIAENHLASVSSESILLNVNYPPIIYDFPVSPYFALHGSDVDFECKATQKTAVNFTWILSPDVIVSHSSHLILNAISQSHKGSYHCYATNLYGTSNATLTIRVLSSPIIELESSLAVVEGETLRAQCNVIPSYSNISWWIDSRCIGTTATLEIMLSGVRPVAIDCRATVFLKSHPGRDVLSSNQKSVNVIVQYKPRRPSIAVHPVGPLLVGKDVTVTCVPDPLEPGQPKPDYSWERAQSRWTKNSTNFLSFSSLTFSDSDVYVCSLFNIFGKSENVTLDLVIYGKPQLLITDSQSPSLVKVKEGHVVSVSCHFQSHPPPDITWLYNDLIDFQTVNTSSYTLQKSANSFTSLLHLNLTLQTSLRCFATNTYGTSFHDFNVQVQYPPRVISTTFMVAADPTGRTPSRDVVNLNCTVFGVPLPIVTWSRKLVDRDGQAIENSTQYSMKERRHSNIVENVMFLREFREEDYGRYCCLAWNSEGRLEIPFELRRLSVPDASHDLILYKQSWSTLSFKWVPGFDGGYPQMFTVSYLTDMQKRPNQMKVYQPNANIIQLLPDTFYTVTISSSNTLGTTRSTLSVKVKTEAIRILEEKVLAVNMVEQVLELRLPLNLSTDIFCLTVEEMDENGNLPASWKMLIRCMRDVYSRVSVDNLMGRFRVRICLINDSDVCSSPIADNVALETTGSILTTKLIGTVAVVCTILVIMLAILLSSILVRTRRLLPGMTSLKDIKLIRHSSRDDLQKHISKPITPNRSHDDNGIPSELMEYPLLSSYSCDPFHLCNAPLEIFNVCSPNYTFTDGLYSTLIKSNSLNLFSNDVSTSSTFKKESPCCCPNDQPMLAVPIPAKSTIKSEKIFFEVMV